MDGLLMIIAILLFIISTIGLINSIVKRKSKTVWLSLIIVSLLSPFIIVVVFDRADIFTKDKPAIVENVDKNKSIEEETYKADSVKLPVGAYTVGVDIDEGIYDVEFSRDEGKLLVENPDDDSMVISQDIASNDIVKVRVHLFGGDQISIQNGDSIFVPVELDKYEYEELSLYPGIWYVGDSIEPGLYKVVPMGDSVGQVTISDTNNKLIADGKVGRGEELQYADIELLAGDKMRVLDMNFKLVPSKVTAQDDNDLNVNIKQVKLKEGKYVVGKDIAPGLYDVDTMDKTGQLTVVSRYEILTILQNLGSDDIKKLRVDIREDDKITTTVETQFTPSEQKKYEYEELTFHPGVWHVGRDIMQGRYKITPVGDSIGYLAVVDKDGKVVGNGEIGKGQQTEYIITNLYDGDIIRVLNINFNLIPESE